MIYKWFYRTPEGFDDILLNSDGEVLTGLWFVGSKDAAKHEEDCAEELLPIFEETGRWLDVYFSGKNPDFVPRYRIGRATEFRRAVSEILRKIPYGEIRTYKEIAELIAKEWGIAKMSSQAVGGAVGWNPICIIIPCHRVVGTDGSLTGYGGGVRNKEGLLRLERSGGLLCDYSSS